MSSHFNFKEKKCWSCEYFAGNREVERGFFFGNSVKTDNSGLCMNKKSYYFNKTQMDFSYCSDYKICPTVQMLLEKEKMEKAKKEAQRKIELEKQNLEREKEELEKLKQNSSSGIKYYSRSYTYKTTESEQHKSVQKPTCKQLLKYFVIAIILIVSIVSSCSVIKSCNYKNSNTGKVAAFIEKNSIEGAYGFTKTINGKTVEFDFSYDKNYYKSSDVNSNKTYDFRLFAILNESSQVVLDIRFNWEDLNNLDNISIYSQVNYKNCTIYLNFYKLTKQTCPNVNYGDYNFKYYNNDYALYPNEAANMSWELCQISFIALNELSNEILNKNLW